MKRHTLFSILCLFACLPLLSTCAADKAVRQGFGLHTYTAELRTSDIRDGKELSTGTLLSQTTHYATKCKVLDRSNR